MDPELHLEQSKKESIFAIQNGTECCHEYHSTCPDGQAIAVEWVRSRVETPPKQCPAANLFYKLRKLFFATGQAPTNLVRSIERQVIEMALVCLHDRYILFTAELNGSVNEG